VRPKVMCLLASTSLPAHTHKRAQHVKNACHVPGGMSKKKKEEEGRHVKDAWHGSGGLCTALEKVEERLCCAHNTEEVDGHVLPRTCITFRVEASDDA
jgi:hypothetical protein